LSGLFRGDWHSLSESQADALDRALHRHDLESIRVDRQMLSQSREAWVHVIVSADKQETTIPLLGLSEHARGVLIWPNSD
jgi:hypothetical protein